MIYKQLQLKNYKSFDDITFSLTSKYDVPKKLAIIYGSNGSGKSTLLESFATLHDLTHTKDITGTLDSIKEKIRQSNKFDRDEFHEFQKILSRGVESISDIYDKIKGLSSNLPTTIKLDFEHDGHNGSYEVRLFDEKIVYEELKFLINKYTSCYYKIDNNKAYINDKIIIDKQIKSKFKELITQSWGVHSFISIIKTEFENYNKEYINTALLNNFINITYAFDCFNYRICNYSNTIEGLSKSNSYLLSHISGGYIEKTTQKALKSTANALSKLLKNYVDDLEKVEYHDDDVSYHLFLVKRINGHKKNIPFQDESSGIKELIKITPYCIKAINGETVVLDEYANHMHDITSTFFLQSIIPQIKGQLIISTHSTILLKDMTNKYYESYYYISVKKSKRKIDCITDIETRIRKENDYQKKYLSDGSYEEYRNNFDTDIQNQIITSLDHLIEEVL